VSPTAAQQSFRSRFAIRMQIMRSGFQPAVRPGA
jgi:hypothetical protein